ncbi:hypothetical protein [Xanthomonas oryzae pv. oryzae MAFF 311018]|nr:hypothetical protein [Xanthomonas oryzae pv. oryzae MAFF 311018]
MIPGAWHCMQAWTIGSATAEPCASTCAGSISTAKRAWMATASARSTSTRGSAVWPTCTGSDPRGVSGASLAPLLPRDVHPPAEVRTGRSRRSSVRPTGDSMNTLTRTALAIALAASATPAFAQSAGHWTTGYGAGYVSQVQ